MVDVRSPVAQVSQVVVEGVALVTEHHEPPALGTPERVQVFIPATVEMAEVQVFLSDELHTTSDGALHGALLAPSTWFPPRRLKVPPGAGYSDRTGGTRCPRCSRPETRSSF